MLFTLNFIPLFNARVSHYNNRFFCFLFSSFYSQINLVPNPSFETYTTCPNTSSQIEYATSWFNPTLHSPDYFNSCSSGSTYSVSSNFFGDQNARTGSGYAGIGVACYNGTREYIEVKLSDSLSPSKSYYVEFFVSLSDSSNYATDDIGIYFSKNKITSNTIDSLGYVPQIKNPSGNIIADKINWTKIQGTFSIPNYEKFIIIGNFNGHKATDSVFIGNGGNISNPNYNGAYYYIDDITVVDASSIGINEVFEEEHNISVVNREGSIEINCTAEYTYELYNIEGKIITMSNLKLKNKNLISTETLPHSVYILSVTTVNENKIIKIIL